MLLNSMSHPSVESQTGLRETKSKPTSAVFASLVLILIVPLSASSDTVAVLRAGKQYPIANARHVLICEMHVRRGDADKPPQPYMISVCAPAEKGWSMCINKVDILRNLRKDDTLQIQWFTPEERSSFFRNILRPRTIRADVKTEDGTKVTLWMPQLRRVRPAPPPGYVWVSSQSWYLPELDYLPVSLKADDNSFESRDLPFRDLRHVSFAKVLRNGVLQIDTVEILTVAGDSLTGTLRDVPYERLKTQKLFLDFDLWGITEIQSGKNWESLKKWRDVHLIGAKRISLRDIAEIKLIAPNHDEKKGREMLKKEGIGEVKSPGS